LLTPRAWPISVQLWPVARARWIDSRREFVEGGGDAARLAQSFERFAIPVAACADPEVAAIANNRQTSLRSYLQVRSFRQGFLTQENSAVKLPADRLKLLEAGAPRLAARAGGGSRPTSSSGWSTGTIIATVLGALALGGLIVYAVLAARGRAAYRSRAPRRPVTGLHFPDPSRM